MIELPFKPDECFLSPEWVRTVGGDVVSALHESPRVRPFMKGLNLHVIVCVQALHPFVGRLHGADTLVLHAKVRAGKVRFCDPDGTDDADVKLTVDYESAQQLYRGELGLIDAFTTGRLVVQPLGKWGAARATKCVVIGNAALRFSRQARTTFPDAATGPDGDAGSGGNAL